MTRLDRYRFRKVCESAVCAESAHGVLAAVAEAYALGLAQAKCAVGEGLVACECDCGYEGKFEVVFDDEMQLVTDARFEAAEMAKRADQER